MRKLLLTTLLCAGMLPAADFAGTWLGQIPFTFNGQHLRMFQQIAIKIAPNGNTIEGKLYGDYGSAAITEGKISGDQIDFVVVAREQQGNQINDTRLHFSGTIQPNGEIEMSRVRESATNAGNGGVYKYKTEQAKTIFRLTRLP